MKYEDEVGIADAAALAAAAAAVAAPAAVLPHGQMLLHAFHVASYICHIFSICRRSSFCFVLAWRSWVDELSGSSRMTFIIYDPRVGAFN